MGLLAAQRDTAWSPKLNLLRPLHRHVITPFASMCIASTNAPSPNTLLAVTYIVHHVPQPSYPQHTRGRTAAFAITRGKTTIRTCDILPNRSSRIRTCMCHRTRRRFGTDRRSPAVLTARMAEHRPPAAREEVVDTYLRRKTPLHALFQMV